MSGPLHRIRRQIVEIAVTDRDSGRDLQARVAALQASAMKDILDRCLSRVSGPGRRLRIERLELDLGVLPLADFENAFLGRLTPALQGALEREQRGQGERREQGEPTQPGSDAGAGGGAARASALELLALFARSGVLPWWADAVGATRIEDTVADLLRYEPSGLLQRWADWAADPDALGRLINHLGDDTLAIVWGALAFAGGRDLAAALSSVEGSVRALGGALQGVAGSDARRLRAALWRGALVAACRGPRGGAGPTVDVPWGASPRVVADDGMPDGQQPVRGAMPPVPQPGSDDRLQRAGPTVPAATQAASATAERGGAGRPGDADGGTTDAAVGRWAAAGGLSGAASLQPEAAARPWLVAAAGAVVAARAAAEVADVGSGVAGEGGGWDPADRWTQGRPSAEGAAGTGWQAAPAGDASPTVQAEAQTAIEAPDGYGARGAQAEAGADDRPGRDGGARDGEDASNGRQRSTLAGRGGVVSAAPGGGGQAGAEAADGGDGQNPAVVRDGPSGGIRAMDDEVGAAGAAAVALARALAERLRAHDANVSERLQALAEGWAARGQMAGWAPAVDGGRALGAWGERLQALGLDWAPPSDHSDEEVWGGAGLTAASSDGQRGQLHALLVAMASLIQTAMGRPDAQQAADPRGGVPSAADAAGGSRPTGRAVSGAAAQPADAWAEPGAAGAAQQGTGAAAAAVASPRAHDDIGAAPDLPSAADALARGLDFSDTDEAYLENAGLVLLWPFFETLLVRLALLHRPADGGAARFVGRGAQHRAAGLLGYLATGDRRPAEYQVLLPKLLCGIGLTEVFEFGRPVTSAEAQECDELLTAAVATARCLGAISADGLRGSFLLRKGILRAGLGTWQLQVEAMQHDVVLLRLPWGLSWVKFPWMAHPLAIDW